MQSIFDVYFYGLDICIRALSIDIVLVLLLLFVRFSERGFEFFRSETLSFRTDRLSGDVAITVPVAWQSIDCLIFGGLAPALTFLSLLILLAPAAWAVLEGVATGGTIYAIFKLVFD